jgi:LEA14-like dessication related protein
MTRFRARVYPLQRHLVLIILLSAVWVFSGCATLDRIIQKPTATFAGIQITDADLLHAKAVLNFNVSNPNVLNIRASRITYDLKINGRDLVAGELDQGITLVGGSTTILSIPFSIQYLDFFESLAQLWEAKGADYALFGGFSVGPFRVPLQAHGSFELPKMPKISMEAIQIEELSLDGARLNCRLKMDNPNAFDLLFKRLEYSLNIGGISFARASASVPSPIKSRRSSMVSFGLDVSFAQLGLSVYQLFKQSEADFSLSGGMVLAPPSGKEQRVPFRLNGKVPFKR